MFLRDTMVISEETKRTPNPLAAAWLSRSDPGRLFLSVASIAEIKRGISRQKPLDQPFADRLEGWLWTTERRFGERLLSIDAAIVVTGNLRHFHNTRVRVFDPYEAIS